VETIADVSSGVLLHALPMLSNCQLGHRDVVDAVSASVCTKLHPTCLSTELRSFRTTAPWRAAL
jgi:hypothetical protein